MARKLIAHPSHSDLANSGVPSLSSKTIHLELIILLQQPIFLHTKMFATKVEVYCAKSILGMEILHSLRSWTIYFVSDSTSN